MFTISEEVLNQVLSILVQLPYNQSHDAIEALQRDVKRIETETPQKVDPQ